MFDEESRDVRNFPFKVKLMGLSNLSKDIRGSETSLDDKFNTGDFVAGKDENGVWHQGEIVRIEKVRDLQSTVHVLVDGDTVALVGPTVKFIENGEKGNARNYKHLDSFDSFPFEGE